jgi:hypothetical protein
LIKNEDEDYDDNDDDDNDDDNYYGDDFNISKHKIE